jgi:hypothetical protein
VEQDKAQGNKEEISTEIGTNSQKLQNWTVQFGKPEHPVSPESVQKGTSRISTQGTTPAPHWCPTRLTPKQRRRIHRMRAHKLRAETAEKTAKKEWSVEEKTSTPMLIASDDDMNLLDDNKSPLIKDGSPPPTGMDINMVFMLPAEFSGVEKETAQMCLGPKEAMFKNPEEWSQHLKLLYV